MDDEDDGEEKKYISKVRERSKWKPPYKYHYIKQFTISIGEQFHNCSTYNECGYFKHECPVE